jgi:hypothetical protein
MGEASFLYSDHGSRLGSTAARSQPVVRRSVPLPRVWLVGPTKQYSRPPHVLDQRDAAGGCCCFERVGDTEHAEPRVFKQDRIDLDQVVVARGDGRGSCVCLQTGSAAYGVESSRVSCAWTAAKAREASASKASGLSVNCMEVVEGS